jgi:aspartate aminotransferase/aminotransferase
MSGHIAAYRRKRDRIVAGLSEAGYTLTIPGGAFYAFPEAPRGTGTEFVARAIAKELLIIPGNIFSRRDTHFRISYAAADETIERGLAVLRKLIAGQ